jgi:hypothetical protein
VEKRIFSKQNITNFNDQLETESWDEVYLHSNANSAYCFFLSNFRKYCLDFFPLKKVINKNGKKLGWITRGIKVSRQRLKLLCLLKKDVPVRPFFEIHKKNIKKSIGK